MSDKAGKAEQSWSLPRLWAVLMLLLIGVTYRLWLAMPDGSGMPLIPLLRVPQPLTPAATMAPLLILLGCLLGIAVAPYRCRRLWWVVSAALLACFLVDQHRLQPWAYQSTIYAAVFACMSAPQARRWLRPLAASIYLYSAAGKFDYQFAHTVGQEFLATLLLPVGDLGDGLGPDTRTRIALALPVTELAAGIGLLFRKTRRIAAIVVILMHATLLTLLGPWGLDHSAGVLMWNFALIIQAYVLFYRTAPVEDRAPVPSVEGRYSFASSMVRLVVLVAIVAPLAERSGYWDHWTSWSLYSPHTSRVEIQLHRTVVPSLHRSLQPFVAEDVDGDGWSELSIDRWSLIERGVPIYPQARYQLALAAELADHYELGDAIRARMRSVSDRWTGQRTEERFLGQQEIRAGLQEFWLTRW